MKYQVWFWNAALNKYSQDAEFTNRGDAIEYSRHQLRSMGKCVTYARITRGREEIVVTRNEVIYKGEKVE